MILLILWKIKKNFNISITPININTEISQQQPHQQPTIPTSSAPSLYSPIADINSTSKIKLYYTQVKNIL